MLGLCTKHCTIIAIIAALLTLAGGQLVPAPVHLPVGEAADCQVAWQGFPLGYQPETVPACLSGAGRFLGFFLNGLINLFVFFYPLRLLHDRFMHKEKTENGKQ